MRRTSAIEPFATVSVKRYQGSAAEAAFLDNILKLAAREGWLAYHHYDSRQSTGKGFPDLILVRGKRLIVAELKSADGRVTHEQAVWLNAIEATGRTEVYMWRPADWLAVEAALRR